MVLTEDNFGEELCKFLPELERDYRRKEQDWNSADNVVFDRKPTGLVGDSNIYAWKYCASLIAEDIWYTRVRALYEKRMESFAELKRLLDFFELMAESSAWYVRWSHWEICQELQGEKWLDAYIGPVTRSVIQSYIEGRERATQP